MSRKNVTTTADKMYISVWLAVSSSGGLRLTANPPALGADEISMALQVAVPRAIFRKPSIEARIEVPASSGAPVKITAEMETGIKNAVKQETGLDVNITVRNPE